MLLFPGQKMSHLQEKYESLNGTFLEFIGFWNDVAVGTMGSPL